MILSTIRAYRAEFGTARLSAEAVIIPAVVVAWAALGVML